MVFLSFFNLGLAFLYFIFATYMAVPVGWAVPGGVALFVFIFLLDQVLEKSGSFIWFIVGVGGVAVTTCLTSYSIVSVGDNGYLDGLTVYFVILSALTVLAAVFTIAIFLAGEDGADSEDVFAYGVICFYVMLIAATLANSVLFASVLSGMLFA